VLDSSVYNIFALLGRKAPFTRSSEKVRVIEKDELSWCWLKDGWSGLSEQRGGVHSLLFNS